MSNNNKNSTMTSHHFSVSTASNHDYRIMATADDAVIAKHAAVQAGYYHDRFVTAFLPTRQQSRRRPPVQVIIKRGTFARQACIEKALNGFLEHHKERPHQVLVLGAGKDTSFFRYIDRQRRQSQQHHPNNNTDDEDQNDPNKRLLLKWYEVDLEEEVREKVSVVKRNRDLFLGTQIVPVGDNHTGDTCCCCYELLVPSWREGEGGADDDEGDGEGNNNGSSFSCHWISHNLRDDPNVLIRDKLIQLAGFDPSLPTLLIFECVQMYLPVADVDALLTTIVQTCTTTTTDSTDGGVDGGTGGGGGCYLVSYEPILGKNDPFGNMMDQNLTKVGVVCEESCLVQTRTLHDYLTKYRDVGFTTVSGCDMHVAYETVIPVHDRTRANRCEFLDELEEWILIMKHYCFVVAEITTTNNDTYPGATWTDSIGFVPGRFAQIVSTGDDGEEEEEEEDD